MQMIHTDGVGYHWHVQSEYDLALAGELFEGSTAWVDDRRAWFAVSRGTSAERTWQRLENSKLPPSANARPRESVTSMAAQARGRFWGRTRDRLPDIAGILDGTTVTIEETGETFVAARDEHRARSWQRIARAAPAVPDRGTARYGDQVVEVHLGDTLSLECSPEGHEPRLVVHKAPPETAAAVPPEQDDPAWRDDATDAAVRVGARQLRKLVRDPLAALVERHLGPDDPSLRVQIAAFLRTDVGECVVGAVLSAVLLALPDNAGPWPGVLAQELRVAAMAAGGDLLAEVVTEPLREALATLARGTVPTRVVLDKTGEAAEIVAGASDARTERRS